MKTDSFLTAIQNNFNRAEFSNTDFSTSLRYVQKSQSMITSIGQDMPVYELEKLANVIILDNDRKARYDDYRDMIRDKSLLGAAMRTYADNIVQNDFSINHVIQIETNNESIKMDIEALLYDKLNVDDSAWSVAHDMCQMGDVFGEIVLEQDLKGVDHVRIITRPENVRRVEHKGQLVCWLIDEESEDRERQKVDKYFDKIANPDSIMDFFTLKQVGIFRSNIHSIDEFSKILYTTLVDIFDQENLKLIVEYNTYGEKLFTNLRTLYPMNNDFDEETIVKFHHRLGAKKKSPGVRLHGDKKTIICQDAKTKLRNNRIEISDKNTITEAKMFSRSKNGTYKAQTGNDDAFMTVVLTSAIFDTNDYNEFVEELFDMLSEEEQLKIESALDSYGIKTEGSNIYEILQ